MSWLSVRYLSCVTPESTHQQATVILTMVWEAQNTVEKQQWQQQVGHNEEEAKEKRDAAEETEQLRQEELDKEKEEHHKEERKKNKSKFNPILQREVPMILLIIVSTLATWCMEKGDYVPLWCFTNVGLDDAMKAFNILEEEALLLIRRSDSSTLLVPAISSKGSRNVIEGSKLSWDECCITAPHMILVMSWAEWLPNHITMMTEFWSNLNMHPYRSSRDQLDRDVLLLYQAEWRKLWHQAINSPGHSYDLSQINKELLHQTKDRLYWLKWEWKDQGRDLHVSNLLIDSSFPTTDNCMIPPPFFFLLVCNSCFIYPHSKCLLCLPSCVLVCSVFSGCTLSAPSCHGFVMEPPHVLPLTMLLLTLATSNSMKFHWNSDDELPDDSWQWFMP